MPRKYFTDEQIEILKKSPYVTRVSKANVFFTEEFKLKFLNLYNKGFSLADIIRSFDIDPKILGTQRIKSLTRRTKSQSSRPEGFSRKENSSKGKPRKIKHPEFSNDSQKAEYYKEYSERLEQEIELLKKIQALEETAKVSRAKSSK